MSADRNRALDALRHHVSGAVERGEAEPIVGRPSLDFSAAYAVDGYAGVAFYLRGYVREPLIEDGEWIGEWLGDCEDAYEVDTSRVVAVMIGDDREHIVDVDDLTMLGESQWCAGCGQIGCHHG